MGAKKCTKCGKEKTLDDFHKRRAGSKGHSSHCKACRAKYYAENEGVRDRQRKHCEENADEIRARKARHRREDPDKAREDDARYRRQYPEKVKARKASRPLWMKPVHLQLLRELKFASQHST